jgi:hypothetical protein
MTHIGEIGFVLILWISWLSLIAACVYRLFDDLFRGDYHSDSMPGAWFAFLVIVLGVGFLVLWAGPALVVTMGKSS